MKKVVWSMLVVLLMVLTACGGGNDTSNGEVNNQEGSNQVTIEASNYEFDQEVYHAKAGDVVIELVSEEGVHGITIDGVNGFEIQNEGTQTVQLKPGEYTIRCSIPCGTGHMDMLATLIVE